MKIILFFFALGMIVFFIAYGTFPIAHDTVFWGWVAIGVIGSPILGWAAKYEDDDSDPYLSKKAYVAIALLPWAAAALLYANAALDSSAPVRHRAIVVSRSKGRYGMDIQVSPWWQHHGELTIPVNEHQYVSLEPGTAVEILVKSGALSISWIADVKARP